MLEQLNSQSCTKDEAHPYPHTIYKWVIELNIRTKAKSFLKERKILSDLGFGKIEWNTKSMNYKAKGIISFPSTKLTYFSIDDVKKGQATNWPGAYIGNM